jgi:hypothetical protein
MYKIIIGFLFIFSTFAMSAQQNNFLHEVAIGVNGGANLYKVSFKYNNRAMDQELGNVGMSMGVKSGISVRYISMKHFGVQLEANFMQGGWNEKFKSNKNVYNVNFSDVKISRRLNYIEIPLLAHIYFGRKLRFFVNLGPKLGFLTTYGKLESNLSSNQFGVFKLNDPRIHDENNEHSKLDYGLSGGGGLDLQIGRLHTVIEARYTYGFGDVYSNSKSDIYQRSNNQDIAITIAFLLPVKTFYRN